MGRKPLPTPTIAIDQNEIDRRAWLLQTDDPKEQADKIAALIAHISQPPVSLMIWFNPANGQTIIRSASGKPVEINQAYDVLHAGLRELARSEAKTIAARKGMTNDTSTVDGSTEPGA